MGSASYHSTIIDNSPSQGLRKKRFKNGYEGIEYYPTKTIPKLLFPVALYKRQEKMYELDKKIN